MWCIAFDCDSKIAFQWNIYAKIQRKLTNKKEKLFFQRAQGSIYTTTHGLSMLHRGIEAMRTIPHIKAAIKKISVFQVLDGSDFASIF